MILKRIENELEKKLAYYLLFFFYNIESRLFFINSFLLAIGIGDFKNKD